MSADGVRQVLLAVLGLAVLGGPALALGWLLPGRRLSEPVDRAVAAGATALGITIVGGLVLNVLPPGLDTLSWLGLAVVVALAAVAVWRRERGRTPRTSGAGDAGEPERQTAIRGGPLLRRSEGLAFGLAGVLVVAAVGLAAIGVHQPSEPFTQLWLVPGTSGGAVIGVESHEAATTTYRVEIVAGGGVAARIDSLVLAPGQSWTGQLQLTLPTGSEAIARLYRTSDPSTIYRQAGLWGPISAS